MSLSRYATNTFFLSYYFLVYLVLFMWVQVSMLKVNGIFYQDCKHILLILGIATIIVRNQK